MGVSGHCDGCHHWPRGPERYPRDAIASRALGIRRTVGGPTLGRVARIRASDSGRDPSEIAHIERPGQWAYSRRTRANTTPTFPGLRTKNLGARERNAPVRKIQIRLSSGEVDALGADNTKGIKVNRLAAAYGIHRTTVMRHLERRGVETRRSRRPLTDSQLDQAVVMYSLGRLITSIAKEMNIDSSCGPSNDARSSTIAPVNHDRVTAASRRTNSRLATGR